MSVHGVFTFVVDRFNRAGYSAWGGWNLDKNRQKKAAWYNQAALWAMIAMREEISYFHV